MLNFMKGVDERLNNMDERISQLLERVDKFSGNLDTVIAVTNNISLEIAKSNKTECSTKMDQNTMSTNPPEPETTVSPPTKQDWPLDRQLKIGPPKSFTDLSPKNVTNIILMSQMRTRGSTLVLKPLTMRPQRPIQMGRDPKEQKEMLDLLTNKQNLHIRRKSSRRMLDKKTIKTPSSNILPKVLGF
ncbi:hypothetical protein SESBI_26460 [Sesbania bispinosa]|nr:hypothetical protein SESBI_26460 [Sesbania bispinosa]